MSDRIDTTRIVNVETLPDVVKMFLTTLSHSTNSKELHGRVLAEFFNIVKKDPEKVTIHDWDRYAAYLNTKIGSNTQQPMSNRTKKTYHGCIRGFYRFATPRFMREGKQFLNPIPELKYAGLTITISRKIKENKLLTREQMKEILAAARAKGWSKYTYFLIKKHTGMRNVEASTIRIADIHLEERWIGTGLEDGARKSNKNGENPLPFFIPQFLVPELKIYMLQLQYTNPGNVWLFPGKNGPMCRNSIILFIKRLSKTIKIDFKGHWFRHTLNTYRKYEKQCPREIRKQLLNHKTSEAIDVYDEGSMKMRRDDYDKYHPYSDL